MTVGLPTRRDLDRLGPAAGTWSGVARAQESAGRRCIGVLVNLMADVSERWVRDAAIREAQEFGRTEGRNVQIDHRWGAADAARYRKFAPELGARGPDILCAGCRQVVGSLRHVAGTTPIVFASTNDPLLLGEPFFSTQNDLGFKHRAKLMR